VERVLVLDVLAERDHGQPIQQWRLDHTPFGLAEDLTNRGGVARKVLCRRSEPVE
jgi:hypothetical protein